MCSKETGNIFIFDWQVLFLMIPDPQTFSKGSGHSVWIAGTVLFFLVLMIFPVFAEETSTADTLTRGGRFTITVTGDPNTAYYIWLTGTFSLSGEQYDQPPVLISSTLGLEQDPAGGPYTIGSYAYYNGGGRTILDDIAPSTSTMSNTQYYGKITTDSDGVAVVTFTTSVYTATRKFSVRVENPKNPGSDTAIQETVYNRKSPSILAATTPTIQPTQTFVTRIITPNPTTTIPTTTPVMVPSTSQPAPTQKAGPALGYLIAVFGIGIFLRQSR